MRNVKLLKRVYGMNLYFMDNNDLRAIPVVFVLDVIDVIYDKLSGIDNRT